MIKVGILGAAGRMGRRLIACICADDEMTLAGALESSSSEFIGQDACRLAGCEEMGIAITSDHDAAIANTDVLIDFSFAESTIPNLEAAVHHSTPMVIGTTGHGDEQKVSIERLAEKVPVVMAPNMSVGVNLLWRLIRQAAEVLQSDYDVEIVEAHHRLKADAPSGTAMRCAEVLAEALNRDLAKDAVYHREGMMGARQPNEIGIQTIRGGDIVGDHTVLFAGIGERLEITHRASSRDTFAKGALRAAKWLIDREPGLYDMQDVLGL